MTDQDLKNKFSRQLGRMLNVANEKRQEYCANGDKATDPATKAAWYAARDQTAETMAGLASALASGGRLVTPTMTRAGDK